MNWQFFFSCTGKISQFQYHHPPTLRQAYFSSLHTAVITDAENLAVPKNQIFAKINLVSVCYKVHCRQQVQVTASSLQIWLTYLLAKKLDIEIYNLCKNFKNLPTCKYLNMSRMNQFANNSWMILSAVTWHDWCNMISTPFHFGSVGRTEYGWDEARLLWKWYDVKKHPRCFHPLIQRESVL